MVDLRELPSVDRILQIPEVGEWAARYGRPLCLQAIRATLDEVRARYPQTKSLPAQDALLQDIHLRLESWTRPTLLPVINASGVILHTNLGRAPLSKAAIQAMQEASRGYSNLEYDLAKGKRGSRTVHAEDLLITLTGAEAALVVNNNAAAVLLALTALARGGEADGVVIARSQLVEIGGGFRVPEVMKQSGATLIEVGTTNRVHLQDYKIALEEHPVALFLRAHRSNFQIVGFTSEPSLSEIAALAHQVGIPVVDDLGSGCLLDTSAYGLNKEPTIADSLADGADLVCFSGDKLLGGPQAGIIVGRAALIDRLKRHPLARAIRADKLCLSALTATLLHYMKDEAEREIPIWRMIATPAEALSAKAESWAAYLKSDAAGVNFSVLPGQSTIGGGSLPGETLPTSLLAIEVAEPDRLIARLREQRPPMIARIQDDLAVFDPRTVLPEEEQELLTGILRCLEE